MEYFKIYDRLVFPDLDLRKPYDVARTGDPLVLVHARLFGAKFTFHGSARSRYGGID